MRDTAQTFNRPLGPFAVLYEPRSAPSCAGAPKAKRVTKSKTEQSAISLETPEQRRDRQAADRQKKMAEILRKNKYSDTARSTNSDKTDRIIGRRNSARSQ